MPTKDTLIYIGEESDGTKVYWNPYYCMKEFHFPDGKGRFFQSNGPRSGCIGCISKK